MISAQQVASAAVRYAEVFLDGEDVYWLEGRPQEKGRTVVVRKRGDDIFDLLPEPWNVRSRVHEYGGGALAIDQGQFWFVNDADQQVYHSHTGVIDPLTGEPGCRYADLVFDSVHHCLYAVREDHRDETRHEPVNELVRIDLYSGVVKAIAQGDDFYASPAISADGSHLAWLSWQHPNMPWDQTTLWLAEVTATGDLANARQIINQDRQSVFQPEWSPDGRLYFVNDPEGWWQLYRLNRLSDITSIERVCHHAAEMGLPLWQFGMRTYAFQDEDRVIATLCEQGVWRLIKLCTNTGVVEPLALAYNSFSSIAVDHHSVAIIAAGADCGDEVVRIDTDSGQQEVCSRAPVSQLDPNWLSLPQAISFPTTDDAQAHGFYYPLVSPEYEPMPDELPPLLVMSHGGPTGSTSPSFKLRVQYWTSRGFAVLDVNYRGSTGYGRQYRELLKKKWGIYDVDDVVAGASYLVEKGLVDPQRLAIRGSSAGGFTTLAALTFRDMFSIGASYYGISELESLAKDTHKFEARYLDQLIGCYPEERALYAERSPLYHTEKLSCPIIFMQGAEDKVVPPSQAKMMTDVMKKNNIPFELFIFEGEQHGFRKSETIEKSLQLELSFYNNFFGQFNTDL